MACSHQGHPEEVQQAAEPVRQLGEGAHISPEGHTEEEVTAAEAVGPGYPLLLQRRPGGSDSTPPLQAIDSLPQLPPT